jgi:FKBP-type peptidyl-prolyl cis-trans isomerase FkpA
MKQLFLSLFVYLMLSGNESCVKSASDCINKTPASEQSAMVAYATSHSITYTVHSSGIFYQIISAGSGATPVSTSKVSVTYTGKLTNDTVFDTQNNPVQLNISDVIQGWQIGLPLIHKGGEIKLIIPSSLAYGCRGFSAVPGDSILVFDIILVDVQ